MPMALVKKHFNWLLATLIIENKELRSRKKLLCGIPQVSVLGPIIFNIYSNNLFLFLNKIDVCAIADDSTLFVCEKYFAELLEKLERNSELAINWFENNYMRLNTDIRRLHISGHKYEQKMVKID